MAARTWRGLRELFKSVWGRPRSRSGIPTLFMAAALYGGLFIVPLEMGRDQQAGRAVGPAAVEGPQLVRNRPFAPFVFGGMTEGVPRLTPPTATTTPTATPTATPTFTPTPTATPTPMPTPDGVLREAEIPILMYHYVSDPGPNADVYRRDLSVLPEAFETQMAYLSEAGYHSVSLRDLVFHLQTGMELPLNPVVLTFDDGYLDNYTQAYPVLQRYGFIGTFSIITGLVDQNTEGYMNWEQIKELHSQGMEIGSHTYTHPDLRGRSDDYIIWQVLGSKEAIEARIEEPVRFFCYPSGMYDEATVRILRQLDFWGATTTEQGKIHTQDHLFDLKRIRVRGDDDLARFIYKVEELTWE